MFSLRRTFALLAISLGSYLVMTAPIPQPDSNGGGSGLGDGKEVDPKTIRTINGKNATLDGPISLQQDEFYMTYNLVDGWEGKPAIVQILSTKDKKVTDTRIGYLKNPKVDQLYHSESVDKPNKESLPKEYEYTLVLKDMHKNYPKEGSPELARLHEWHAKDSNMDLAAASKQVREAAVKQAEAIAKDAKLVFLGISPLTVWTNKERDVAYFDTWTDVASVENVDSPEFKAALEKMKSNAGDNYTEEKVRYVIDHANDVAQAGGDNQ